jgi:hypothetical protein
MRFHFFNEQTSDFGIFLNFTEKLQRWYRHFSSTPHLIFLIISILYWYNVFVIMNEPILIHYWLKFILHLYFLSFYLKYLNLFLFSILSRILLDISHVEFPSVGIFLMFFTWLNWVYGLGKEEHRDKVPLSSHYIKGPYYQHDLSLLMLTLTTWLR